MSARSSMASRVRIGGTGHTTPRGCRGGLRSAVLLGLVLLFCLMSNTDGKLPRRGGAASQWCYTEGASCKGPSTWSSLAPTRFHWCQSGRTQSPIDITTYGYNSMVTTSSTLQPLKMFYEHTSYKITNRDGNLLEVTLPAQVKQTARFEGVAYTFSQLHFHYPAEHKFNGVEMLLEAHLVHLSAQGRILIVVVFFDLSEKENHWLKPILAALPNLQKDASVQPESNMCLKSLFDGKSETSDYLYYAGSLTTPPCVEGVRYVLYALKQPITQEQYDLFTEKFNMKNQRPTQGTSKRSVQMPRSAQLSKNWIYTRDDHLGGHPLRDLRDGGLRDRDFTDSRCRSGVHQSPIKLLTTLESASDSKDVYGMNHHPDIMAVITSYTPTRVWLLKTAQHLTLDFPRDKNFLMLLGVRYNLINVRLYVPGLHQLGTSGPVPEVEIHLMHKDDDGNIMVLAVLAKGGDENVALTPLMKDGSDAKGGGVGVLMDLLQLLPDNPNFFMYDGSEVTNPCTEGVKYVVMKTPIQLSGRQIFRLYTMQPSVGVKKEQANNNRIVVSTQFPPTATPSRGSDGQKAESGLLSLRGLPREHVITPTGAGTVTAG